MQRAFVVEPYIPNGGTFMAYHLAKIFSEEFGFDVIAVGDSTPDHNVFRYDPVFPSISIERLATEITTSDVLIANPSFSEHHFGLSLPGHKLMYVQGFNTFKLLDCKFHHYVAVSRVVQRLLLGVYGIDAPVIPAFIGDSTAIDRPPWLDRPERSIIVSSKFTAIYLEFLQECLRQRGLQVEFSFLPSEKMPQQDMLRLIGQYRYFLTLSPAEGFGLMPLEAMSMGALVLGFDGYGGRDFMRSGGNCAVVPYCDIEQMADLIGTVIDDPSIGQRLAEQGVKTAQQPDYQYPSFSRAWKREIASFISHC